MRMPFNRHLHRQLLAAIIEQLRDARESDQPVRPAPVPARDLLIEFAELRHRLLNDRRPTRTLRTTRHSDEPFHPLRIVVWRRYSPESIRLAASRKYPRWHYTPKSPIRTV